MLEFEGTLSFKCRKYILKKIRKLIETITSIVASIFMIALFAFGFVIGSDFLIKFSILFGIFAIFLFPVALGFAATTQKDQRGFMPVKIYIDLVSETIVVVSEKFKDEHAISCVKQIADCGEWYDVEYFFGEIKNVESVIQKDLITEGTIEEFEKLFSDKIVPAKK